MTDEKLFLLDGLRCFIHGEKLNFDADIDLNELIRLGSINSVSGIVGYMAMLSGEDKRARLPEILREQCFTIIAVFKKRAELAQRVTDALSAAGIDHMLFKGYVLRRLYPVPELRSYGDVDILIKPEDRRKSHELMLSLGFDKGTDWEPVYSYHKGAEEYELHTEMMEDDISGKVACREYFNTAWEHAVSVGEHTYEPTPEFHFLYLLAHIAKHIRSSGAGIRMYMDLAVFIREYGEAIDWEYIETELNALKLRDFANLALTVVEYAFHVKSPIALNRVEPDILESFMDFTVDGGTFGFVGRDSGLITLKTSKESSRAGIVMRRLFPKAETIESRYTYLQGRHWLLPAAWVHRFFKTSSAWSEHAEEARSIMNTDEKEVEKLKKIFGETGLE